MKPSVKVPKELETLFELAETRMSELFSEFTSDPSRGTVEISGERYLLLRASSLANDFFDSIAQLFSGEDPEMAEEVARKFLYDFAHAMGKKDAEYYSKKLNLGNPLDKLSGGPIHFAYAGWAFVEVSPESHPSPDQDFFLMYDHPYSFESESWVEAGKKSNFPVCIMNAGYSSGWCEGSFEMPLVAAEIFCKAKGDACCRFVLAPPERIEEHIQKYVEKLPKKIRENVRYEIPKFFDVEKTQQELRQANASLRESEEIYHAISATASDAIFMLNEKGEVVFWNNAATKTFGYTDDDVLGKTLHQLLFSEKYHSIYEEGLSTLFETGKGPLVGKMQTIDAVTKSCCTIPIELSISGVQVKNKWHAVGIMRDISERLEAQSKLLLNKAVIDTANEGVVVTDKNNLIIDVNPAFTLITGYEREDVIGKNPSVMNSGRHDEAFYCEIWHELLTLGRWSGELWNRRKSGEIFPEWISMTSIHDDAGNPQYYVGIFSDISERKAAEMEVHHQANSDVLTGLANRRSFVDRLDNAIEMCKRNDTKAAVFFMDVDFFKKVNDKLGHLAGDELLKKMADRLRECVRSSDTIARFGGDEFSALFYDIKEHEPLDSIAEKMLKNLSKPYTLGDDVVSVSVSIGIAIYPDDASDAEGLLDLSDKAMYRVKNSTRNAISFWGDNGGSED